MSLVQDIIGSVLLFAGLAFMLIGSIGIVRFPDFFTRVHAASVVDTVGIVVALLGIAVLAGVSFDGGKTLFVAFLLMLTNPVFTHALAKAAHRRKVRPIHGHENDDGRKNQGEK